MTILVQNLLFPIENNGNSLLCIAIAIYNYERNLYNYVTGYIKAHLQVSDFKIISAFL